MEIIEVMFGFDQIEIDDNHFQLDGVTDRERDFVNMKSFRRIRDKKANYIDGSISNRPRFIFFFGFLPNGKLYERKVYATLDMIGQVGGLFSFIESIAGIIIYIMTAYTI